MEDSIQIPRARAQKINTEADIVFCIDATGSMQPCIDGIKDGISTLVKGLQSEANVNFRIRFIAYRDYHDPTCGTEWVNTEFTNSVDDFISELSKVQATGGGDAPESTLDALYSAIHSEWRTSKTYKTIILLTDDDTHPTLHQKTYDKPDNDVFRVIQDFQTLRHVMLFMVCPKFKQYELIEKAMISAERKIVCDWVPYGSGYKGLAAVNWIPLMDMLGKTISLSSIEAQM